MKKQIKELKKNDVFIFNSEKNTVLKKYRNDDSPLKAIDERHNIQLFNYEELEVELVKSK